MDATSLLDAYLAREFAPPEGYPYRPVRPAALFPEESAGRQSQEPLRERSQQMRRHEGKVRAYSSRNGAGPKQGMSERSHSTASPSPSSSTRTSAGHPIARAPSRTAGAAQPRPVAKASLAPRPPLQPKNTAKQLPEGQAAAQAKLPGLLGSDRAAGLSTAGADSKAEGSALAKLRSRSMARLAAADRSEHLRKATHAACGSVTSTASLTESHRAKDIAQRRAIGNSSEPSAREAPAAQNLHALRGPSAWPPPPDFKRSSHKAAAGPQSSSLAHRQTQSLGSLGASLRTGQPGIRRHGRGAAPEDTELEGVSLHAVDRRESTQDAAEQHAQEDASRPQMFLPSPPQMGHRPIPTISPLFGRAPAERSASSASTGRASHLPTSLSFDSLEAVQLPTLSTLQRSTSLIGSRHVSPDRLPSPQHQCSSSRGDFGATAAQDVSSRNAPRAEEPDLRPACMERTSQSDALEASVGVAKDDATSGSAQRNDEPEERQAVLEHSGEGGAQVETVACIEETATSRGAWSSEESYPQQASLREISLRGTSGEAAEPQGGEAVLNASQQLQSEEPARQRASIKGQTLGSASGEAVERQGAQGLSKPLTKRQESYASRGAGDKLGESEELLQGQGVDVEQQERADLGGVEADETGGDRPAVSLDQPWTEGQIVRDEAATSNTAGVPHLPDERGLASIPRSERSSIASTAGSRQPCSLPTQTASSATKHSSAVQQRGAIAADTSGAPAHSSALQQRDAIPTTSIAPAHSSALQQRDAIPTTSIAPACSSALQQRGAEEPNRYAAAAEALFAWEPRRACKEARSNSLRGTLGQKAQSGGPRREQGNAGHSINLGGKQSEVGGGCRSAAEASEPLPGRAAVAVQEAVARRLATAALPVSEAARGLQHLRDRWKGFCTTRPKPLVPEQPQQASAHGPAAAQRLPHTFPNTMVERFCELGPYSFQDADFGVVGDLRLVSHAVPPMRRRRVPCVLTDSSSCRPLGGLHQIPYGDDINPTEEPYFSFTSTGADAFTYQPSVRISEAGGSFSSAAADQVAEHAPSARRTGSNSDLGRLQSSAVSSSSGDSDTEPTPSGRRARSCQPGVLLRHQGPQPDQSRRTSASGSTATADRVSSTSEQCGQVRSQRGSRLWGSRNNAASSAVVAVSRTAAGAVDDESSGDDSSSSGTSTAARAMPSAARHSVGLLPRRGGMLLNTVRQTAGGGVSGERLERAWRQYFQRGLERTCALEPQCGSDWESPLSTLGSCSWSQLHSRGPSAIDWPSEPYAEDVGLGQSKQQIVSRPASAAKVLLLPYHSLADEAGTSAEAVEAVRQASASRGHEQHMEATDEGCVGTGG